MGIPRRGPDGPVVHLDSDLLRGMVDDEDRLHSLGSHIKNNNNPKCSLPYKVSFTVIGEVMGLIAQDCGNPISKNAGITLAKLFQRNKIEICGFGERDECFSLAKRLMVEESRLGPTDSIIIACAFIDENCDELWTTDEFMDSIVVGEIGEEYCTVVKEPHRSYSKYY